jgi:hypothetical protein
MSDHADLPICEFSAVHRRGGPSPIPAQSLPMLPTVLPVIARAPGRQSILAREYPGSRVSPRRTVTADIAERDHRRPLQRQPRRLPICQRRRADLLLILAGQTKLPYRFGEARFGPRLGLLSVTSGRRSAKSMPLTTNCRHRPRPPASCRDPHGSSCGNGA